MTPIEKEVLFYEFYKENMKSFHENDKVSCLVWGKAIELLNKSPAIDVAPITHRKWKYYRKQNKAVCTNCSFERDLDSNFGSAISCPNCGACMDLKEG